MFKIERSTSYQVLPRNRKDVVAGIIVAAVMAFMAFGVGDAHAAASATRTAMVSVPSKPGVQVTTIEFAWGGRRPHLEASMEGLAQLPGDVTMISGVKKNPANGRWIGLLTTVRYNTGATPVVGKKAVRVVSDKWFTVTSRQRIDGTEQLGSMWAGGGYRVRARWMSTGTPAATTLGNARVQLKLVGNLIAGQDTAGFLAAVTA